MNQLSNLSVAKRLGLGFAVVASEVRSLAERSQVAAQEISELASGSVKKGRVQFKVMCLSAVSVRSA